MATVYNQQLLAPYGRAWSGIQSRKESFLLSRGHSIVVGANETITVGQANLVTKVVTSSSASGTPGNVVLPAAAESKGRLISVRCTLTSTGAAAVSDESGANVGPDASYELATGETVELFSTGTAWVVTSACLDKTAIAALIAAIP